MDSQITCRVSRIQKIGLVLPPTFVDPTKDYARFSQSQGLPLIMANLPDDIEVVYINASLDGFDQREELDDGMVRVGLSENEIAERLSDCDVVGISCNITAQYPAAVQVGQIARSIGVPTILGGVHATFSYPDICKPKLPFDYIVIGEGVSAMRRLIGLPHSEKPTSEPDNIICCHKQPPLTTPFNIKQINLKSLFPLDYRVHEAARASASRVYAHSSYPVADAMCTVFSIGCPFRCDFCSTVRISKHFQIYNEYQIRSQLRQIKSLGYKYLVIMDDNLLTHQNRARWLFEHIKDIGLRVIYDGGIYINFCNDEMINVMAPVTDRVFVAIERKDALSIDKYKRVNQSQSDLESKRIHLLESLQSAGIKVSGYFIIGHPDEDNTSIRSTLDFAYKLKQNQLIDYASINIVTAYPGTPLWENCAKRGILEIPQDLRPGSYKIFSTSFGNILHPSVKHKRLREWLYTAREKINGTDCTAFERTTLERLELPIQKDYNSYRTIDIGG